MSLQEVKSITTGEAQDAGLVSTDDTSGAVGGGSDTRVREHLIAYLCYICNNTQWILMNLMSMYVV